MTVANYITLLRLLAVPPLLILVYMRSDIGYFLAASIFLFAVATDVFDGVVARKLDQESALGAMLDPLVDKILIYSMLFSLMSVNALAPVIVFPMFIRDMAADGLRNEASAKSNIIGANIWGKAKFGFQALSIVFGLSYCAIEENELAGAANLALLIALLVSVPGLLLIASGLTREPVGVKPRLQPGT